MIRAGLRSDPDNADLWVGLGNALVVHADGMMSPAAELAFQRAAQIAPDHPGPQFFYGLALAQGGKYDEAERDLARHPRQRARRCRMAPDDRGAADHARPGQGRVDRGAWPLRTATP